MMSMNRPLRPERRYRPPGGGRGTKFICDRGRLPVTSASSVISGTDRPFLCRSATARRANAAKQQLCLLDVESVILRGLEAGRFTDHAGHILEAAADPADHVVMVVVPMDLITRRTARVEVDTPQQARSGQGMQSVVYGLLRHSPETFPHRNGDLVRFGVRVRGDDRERRDSRRGDTQSRFVQIST